ncbi:phage tail protein [Enterobacter chengduensis]|uniref:phage tail protein n=1 Tax=Enterobacter TaxID=547 RepID=UPI0006688082|nr:MULTISPECIES: phage tail protein [Enterobacter]HCH0655786.1 phage tail protein [Enterobacter asburiae]ELV3043821.1 phage tail protein [Enterobacter chengduensis]MCK7280406.1 phage tail protein [Enterobacter chengduensis]MDY0421607.1 phage tail protein [Enterobacter sp. 170250]GFZ54030.1 phage tail protein [Enterobacter sp. AS-1]
MTDTFTWATQVSPTATDTINLFTVQFGDGYEQVAINGINNVTEEWELTWTGKKKDVSAIRAFLHTHAHQSFWWSNPWGEKKLYRVKPDSIKPTFISGKVVSVAFTFKQAFAP